MTVVDLFFLTIWTAIGGLLGFCVIGIVEQTDRCHHWWLGRRH